MEICSMTASKLGSALKRRTVGAAEVTRAFLENTEKHNGILNAFITVCGDGAMLRAEEVQRRIDGGDVSPFCGVPIAFKDNISTKGIKTTCASKILENYVPVFDASAVIKTDAAGLVTIGKLNMDEFGFGNTGVSSCFGAAKNPLDTKRTPGGSSSGAASAVAAGLVPWALGTDTGGSVRQPAAYCGVVGFKPTYGTVSRSGLIAFASSFDQIGPIARSVSDCASLYEMIRGADPLDATSSVREPDGCEDIAPKDLRIALLDTDGLNVSESVADAVKNAALLFERNGASVETVRLPSLKYAVPAYYVISSAEASSNLSRFDGVRYGARVEDGDLDGMYKATRSRGFGTEAKRRIMIGTYVLSGGYYDAYYLRAVRAKEILREEFGKLFEKYDLLLSPVSPHTAPLIDKAVSPADAYSADIFTVSANLTGAPALSLPCGKDGNGMPIGLMISGPRFSDRKVLKAGKLFEEIYGKAGAV